MEQRKRSIVIAIAGIIFLVLALLRLIRGH